MPRPPSRYLHPIDDAWRARVLARIEELGWTLSELSRRLERQGITVSRSALRLTLQTQQAGSRFKDEIEREIGLALPTAAQADPVTPPVPPSSSTMRPAKNFEALLLEIAELRDDQVPAALALLRALRKRS